ncbi:Holliday junction branch migration protein RuvA [Bosea sp. RAC05]|uniref:Holliday junction branch migration protein RuvA n=1 Tax=Bosea sp. RAC05 TaxID=1842539 RepID=UPI00083E31F9|nr:Holliday junction branch migration protein RuvA [Bosea sp. RAC05]AOG03121.1 hypothetical protein BSY19_4711 [Bosea sp. RAC05]
MIGRLKGLVESVSFDHLIVDVGGVGYLVNASISTLSRLPAIGEVVALTIETHVREDAIRLFGFLDEADRDWFRLLQSVQGVGTKVALGIQSILTRGEIATAIGTQDKAMVARAPGVGPKLAARICAELKDKAPALGGADLAFAASGGASLPAGSRTATDAVSALVNLGYGQAQASAAVGKAMAGVEPEESTSVIIRKSLKLLATA